MNSQYDLIMKKCYNVADPIANPNPAVLQQLLGVLDQCSSSLPSSHPYKTEPYQAIAASSAAGSTLMTGECIASRCVGESVILFSTDEADSYFSFYAAMLIFYLLTLAEGIEFVCDVSAYWYARMRLMVGVFILAECFYFVIGYYSSLSGRASCPLDLDMNNPPASTYNMMSMGSFLVRCIGLGMYVLARTKPEGLLGSNAQVAPFAPEAGTTATDA